MIAKTLSTINYSFLYPICGYECRLWLCHRSRKYHGKDRQPALRIQDTQMKKVVIIGATSGIGLELARLFARDNWLVGATGKRVNYWIHFSMNFRVLLSPMF